MADARGETPKAENKNSIRILSGKEKEKKGKMTLFQRDDMKKFSLNSVLAK